jgi:hypothetical protein
MKDYPANLWFEKIIESRDSSFHLCMRLLYEERTLLPMFGPRFYWTGGAFPLISAEIMGKAPPVHNNLCSEIIVDIGCYSANLWSEITVD